MKSILRIGSLRSPPPLSGCAIGHAFGVRVLKMDRPAAGGFLSLTAFQAEGCGIALSGDEHEVSVTGLSL